MAKRGKKAHKNAMADAFAMDIDAKAIGPDSEEDFDSEKNTSRSFDDQCGSIKSVMDEDDDEIIKEALSRTAKSAKDTKESEKPQKSVPVDDNIVPEGLEEVGEPDPDHQAGKQEKPQETVNDTSEQSEKPKTTTKKLKEADAKMREAEEEFASGERSGSDDNPLDVSGYDYKFFKEVQKDYPRFNLVPSHHDFKSFYRWKLIQLRYILGRYPVLDGQSLMKEITDSHRNFSLQEATIHPETIRVNINAVQGVKHRVTTILIEVHEQYHIWKRTLETIKGKLWKDHPVKGQEKREGLTLEHLWDFEAYFADLEGIIESAKRLDGYLMSSHDALSRQLGCLELQMKVDNSLNRQGRSLDPSNDMQDFSTPSEQASVFDQLDSISPGSKIDPHKEGAVNTSSIINVPLLDESSEIG